MEQISNSNIDHKNSMLLTKEENDQIFQLLGHRCQTIATTVVQMFSTDGPDGVHWVKRDVGILCLVRDTNRRSYFFRLFCLIQNRMIWEHEIYNSMQYLAPRSFLHTFEAEDRIVAFNFANESEADYLRDILLTKLKTKEQQRISRQNKKSVMTNSQNSVNRPVLRPAPFPNMNAMSNGYPSSAATSTKSGKKFKKKSITKADIGQPQNFKHVWHIGFDPNTGFEIGNVDESIRKFFDKVGISDIQLKDKKTREFIYDFIEKHGGIDAVKHEIHPSTAPAPPSPSPPPPVPARNHQPNTHSSTRSAPPPPPPSGIPRAQHPAPPPPPSMPPPSNVAIQRTNDSLKKQAPVPSAVTTINSARAPPPTPPAPPPPMPPEPVPAPPLPSIGSTSGNSSSAGNDSRSALMEAIRSGTTLKHVEPEVNKLNADKSRGDLLSDIRKGVELKAVQPVIKPSHNALPADSLAGALARALAKRAEAIQPDSSDTSETSDTDDDDDWDD